MALGFHYICLHENPALVNLKIYILCILGGCICSCGETAHRAKAGFYRQKAAFCYAVEHTRANTDSTYIPDYTRAVASAEAAIQCCPYSAALYIEKAALQWPEGDYSGALDTYKRLVGLDTADVRYKGMKHIPYSDFYRAIGSFYDSLGVRDSAETYYAKSAAWVGLHGRRH